VRRKRPVKSRRPRWPFLVLLGVVAVGSLAGWLLMRGGSDEGFETDFVLGEGGSATEAPLSGDRSVVLVFPEWDASGYVTEERQITSRDRPGEDLMNLMTALCQGPKISGAISAMPQGTRALGAFVNPENQAVVLDFSNELVTGHPGGTSAEAATLTSILRTVALNFPGTRDCVILIEGAQVETLAGNLDMERAFDPRRYL
jgi:spore germination protein GerM